MCAQERNNPQARTCESLPLFSPHHDGRVGAPEVGDARLLCKVFRELNERARLGLVVVARVLQGGRVMELLHSTRTHRQRVVAGGACAPRSSGRPNAEPLLCSVCADSQCAPHKGSAATCDKCRHCRTLPHPLRTAAVAVTHHGVVHGKPHALLVCDARAPDLRVHVVDAHERQLVRHRPVHAHTHGLAGRHPRPAHRREGRGASSR